jgi:hypothetical protein
MHTGKPARVFTFYRVEVYITPENGKIIQWWMDPRFEFDAPLDGFYIDWARTKGEWTRLNPDQPIRNMCLYLDEDSYRCGMDNDVWYRVVAVDTSGREYASVPAHTMGEMNRHDWLIARDLLRKEYLRLKKYAGTFGYLLTLRRHGAKCTQCFDFDLEEPIAGSNCTVCYGTGFVGGYYNAIGFYMDLSGVKTSGDVNEPFGYEDTRIRNARAVAYPWLGTYDIWVHGSANRRYVIRSAVTGTEIRSVPLIYFPVELRLLPVSDIAYQVPMEHSVGPVSSTTPTPVSDEGWRKGIAFEEIW